MPDSSANYFDEWNKEAVKGPSIKRFEQLCQVQITLVGDTGLMKFIFTEESLWTT